MGRTNRRSGLIARLVAFARRQARPQDAAEAGPNAAEAGDAAEAGLDAPTRSREVEDRLDLAQRRLKDTVPPREGP